MNASECCTHFRALLIQLLAYIFYIGAMICRRRFNNSFVYKLSRQKRFFHFFFFLYPIIKVMKNNLVESFAYYIQSFSERISGGGEKKRIYYTRFIYREQQRLRKKSEFNIIHIIIIYRRRIMWYKSVNIDVYQLRYNNIQYIRYIRYLVRRWRGGGCKRERSTRVPV